MGFQTAQTNNVAQMPAQKTARNDQYKPDAYINVSMPTRQGGKRKLIGIPLSVTKEFEKKILDHIADAEDQEEVMRQLAGRLTLDFQLATGNGAEPDFG